MGVFNKLKKAQSVDDIKKKLEKRKDPILRHGKSGKTCTYMGRKPTKEDQIHLRRKLCILISAGIYSPKMIVKALYKEFPRYKNEDSIRPRITEACDPIAACHITQYSGGKYNGRLAYITSEGILKWHPKNVQTYFGGDNVRKSTNYRKRKNLF